MTRTLKLHAPDYRLVILIVLLLALFIMAAELLVRMIEPNPILGTPSIGSNYKEFETRLDQFDQYAAERHSIDCVFLGDSTAMTNFAPLVFAEAYHEQTGQDIDCFNFGAGAFTIADSAALARILMQENPPERIILGIEALSFAVSADAPGDVDLTELPWTRYKLGQFSPAGWLYEHSHLLSHLGTVQTLITMEKSPAELRWQSEAANTLYKDGFYPLEGTPTFDVSVPPDPTSDHPYHDNYFSSLSNFVLLPEQRQAFEQIIALNNSTTQVIIVEMPVPPTFYDYFGNDKEDYQFFLQTVQQMLAGSTVPFWTTTDQALFEDNLWFNYNHLNAEGAPIFSQWLGTKLGQAEKNDTLAVSVNSPRSN